MQTVKIIAICGASGTGKTTLAEGLLESHAIRQVPAYTTRAPRLNDDRHYRYIAREEFLGMVESFEFWIELYGNLYGTRRSDIVSALSGEGIAIVNVLVPFAAQLLSNYPTRVHVVCLQTSENVLRERLIVRGDDPGLRLTKDQQITAGIPVLKKIFPTSVTVIDTSFLSPTDVIQQLVTVLPIPCRC